MNKGQDWTFENTAIAKEFDSHVREQLPWYDTVLDGIEHLVKHFAFTDSTVYDIGSATGNLAERLTPIIKARNLEYNCIEPSDEMADTHKAADAINSLIRKDANEVSYGSFSVAILNLTLQFVDYHKRDLLLGALKASLIPGGAIILVDKFEHGGGYFNLALYRMTLANKLKQGATPEQIITKELSLSGIQRPLEPLNDEWLEWFRFGHFSGYVWIK